MLPAGLALTLAMASSDSAIRNTRERRRYALLMLGMYREDVYLIPVFKIALPSPSFGHLWPLSKLRFLQLYQRAIAAARKHDESAYFHLGRALHVLIDMACPAHAKPAAHYLRDPFERYVEHHADALSKLPLPQLPKRLTIQSSQSLLSNLAHTARQEQADLTQSWWGQLLKKAGRRHPLNHAIVEQQAQQLIPLAAAYVKLVLYKFGNDSGQRI